MLDSVLEICSVEGMIELLRTRAQAIAGPVSIRVNSIAAVYPARSFKQALALAGGKVLLDFTNAAVISAHGR
jgi:hypothetical protein